MAFPKIGATRPVIADAVNASLIRELQREFPTSGAPATLVEGHGPITPEQADALHFRGKAWHEIKLEEWEAYPDAFYSFAPSAFQYYLPSILALSADTPSTKLLPAYALIGILDREPNPLTWDTFLTKRLIGLHVRQYELIQAWIISLSGGKATFSEDALTRAYETIDLLKEQSTPFREMMVTPK